MLWGKDVFGGDAEERRFLARSEREAAKKGRENQEEKKKKKNWKNGKEEVRGKWRKKERTQEQKYCQKKS